MHASVSGPGATPHRSGDSSWRCRRRGLCLLHAQGPMLFHSVTDLWSTILSVVKQVPEAKSTLEKASRTFDPSALDSGNAVTHVPLEAIATITHIRFQYPFCRKQKRREPLGAYAMRDVMLLSNTVSSIASIQVGFLSPTESIIENDNFSEHPASTCEQVVVRQRRLLMLLHPGV